MSLQQGEYSLQVHTLSLATNLILACIAMVDRDRKGSMQRLEVDLGEVGATASMIMLRSFVLTSVLLLSEGERERVERLEAGGRASLCSDNHLELGTSHNHKTG